MANRKEIEKQMEELQAQVSALTAQTQGLQAQLQARDAEMQGAQARLQASECEAKELTKQIESYRAREGALVAAMTDAQDVYARKMAETEKRSRSILASAEEQARRTLSDAGRKAREQEARARALEQESAQRAQMLVEDMRTDIHKRLAQIDESSEEFQVRLNRLNQAMGEALTKAREQADAFEQAMRDIMDDVDQLTKQSVEIAAMIDEQHAAGLEELDGASRFMHDIYKLEGRDIPVKAAAPAGMQEPYETFAYGSPEAQAQDYAQYAAQNFADRPAKPAFMPEAAQPPAQPPAQSPTQPPTQPPVQPPALPEEHVWTVDEIIAQHQQSAAAAAAAQPVAQPPLQQPVAQPPLQQPVAQPQAQTQKPGGDGIDLDSLLDEIMG